MSQKTISEIVFGPDCVVEQRVTTTRPIIINDAIISRLAAKSDYTITHAFDLGGRPVSLTVSGETTYATMPIRWIALKAPFKMVGGALVPVLSHDSAPILDLKWNLPSEVAGYFLFQCPFDRGNRRYYLDKPWLFCRTNDGSLWRLPLGNLYDDSSICTGRDSYCEATVREVVKSCLFQINGSLWNSDLCREAEKTQQMFRFVPNAEGFKQIAHDSAWASLCRKISVNVASKLVL